MKQLGQVNFTAIYTCQPYIFVIGCLDGKPYVLETHPISCYSMFWCKDFHQNGDFFEGVDDESTNDFHSRKYSAQFYVYSNNCHFTELAYYFSQSFDPYEFIYLWAHLIMQEIHVLD